MTSRPSPNPATRNHAIWRKSDLRLFRVSNERTKKQRHDPTKSHRIMISTATGRARASIVALEISLINGNGPQCSQQSGGQERNITELTRKPQNVIGLRNCFPALFRGIEKCRSPARGPLASPMLLPRGASTFARDPNTLIETDGESDGFADYLKALRDDVIAFRKPMI